MRFLERLFPKKEESNKEQRQKIRIVKTPTGYKVERNGALLRNATPEEIKKAQEQDNILDLTKSDEENKSSEVPKPGEVFSEQGRPKTVNEAGVVVNPTQEQLATWKKKEEENK